MRNLFGIPIPTLTNISFCNQEIFENIIYLVIHIKHKYKILYFPEYLNTNTKYVFYISINILNTFIQIQPMSGVEYVHPEEWVLFGMVPL